MIICGINHKASNLGSPPGFEEVLIHPALGILNDVEGKMPHPKGEIAVSLKRKGKLGIEGMVSLPENITGRFVWNEKNIILKGGKQTISID